MDVTGWAELRLSLLMDCWTMFIRLCSGPPASGPVVSFRWVYLLVGCCLFRVWGFPPPLNVVNRAYQMDRLRMPIWSFYSKTNIVILTCPSDMFLPVLPTFRLFSDELRIEGEWVWYHSCRRVGARRT